MTEVFREKCGNCSWFTASHYCRLDQKRKRETWHCEHYKIRLSDHYVSNVWDEWKRQAEERLPKRKK